MRPARGEPSSVTISKPVSTRFLGHYENFVFTVNPFNQGIIRDFSLRISIASLKPNRWYRMDRHKAAYFLLLRRTLASIVFLDCCLHCVVHVDLSVGETCSELI